MLAAQDHSPSSEIPIEEGIPTPSNDPLPSVKEIVKLKKRVKKLEKRKKSRYVGLRRLKKGRSIKDIDQDAEIALVDKAHGRMHDVDMFRVDDLEVIAANVEDSVAPTTATTADVDDELTLAKTLIAIKATKPKDDVHATIDADRQLAEQIQAQEREQQSIEERSKLLAELIESRRKYFAAKRAEDIRNKPPQRHNRKVLCVLT
nr:hypothetical protein [Tanacetum cinerariifolium]